MNSEINFRKLSKLTTHPQTATVGKTTLSYIESGSGKPVILLHGANMGWIQWYKNIGTLSKHCRVIALDLPGAGESTHVDFSHDDLTEKMVRPVEQLIKLKKLGQVTLVGHSAGAWVALKIALRKKVAVSKIICANPLGLTNYSPAFYIPISFYPFAQLLTKTVLRPSEKNMQKFLTTAFWDTKKLDPLLVRHVAYQVNKNPGSHPLLLISRIAKPFGVAQEFYLADSLSQLQIPLAVLAAEHDKIVPPHLLQKTVESNKNTKYIFVPDCGHVIPIEKSDVFNKFVLQLL